ncbi:hypothetical protein POTOM_001075 [Populus tomentosa]|uniref:Cadmium-induced protein AS8 n=2 Tax=Populus TaxID=3689 RepID=A0A8X8DH90_POPTO|nr:hypothetical protein POTOM_001075 [Populus tomentosa]
MIIKGLCRRYERWNPVHPTSGAFWGMGIGIGCGVGWGPGFGPEAIGYVGAGCGVGFSVGITFVGFGIGLPANFLFQVPYNAILATRSGALAIAKSNGLLSARDVAGEGWNNVASRASLLQRETSGRLSSFNKKLLLDNGVDLVDMKSKLSVNAGSLSKVLETFSSRFFPPGKGLASSSDIFRTEIDVLKLMLLQSACVHMLAWDWLWIFRTCCLWYERLTWQSVWPYDTYIENIVSAVTITKA